MLQRAHRPPTRSGSCPGPTGLWLDAEDSLALDGRAPAGTPAARSAADVLRVGVVRLPRISNFTDVDALAAEPGVLVRFATDARPSWPTPTWSCCPGPGPPSPTWPGCASAGWPRRSRRARPKRAAGARHLRRLPDARPRHRRPGGIAAPGRSPGLGLLPGGWRSRGRSRWAGRQGSAYGAPSPATRSTTGSPAAGPRGRAVPGRLPGRRGLGDQLARDAGERRVPAGVPGRGRRARRAGLHARAGHRLRRGAGGPAGPARRPGRRAPRHRRAGRLIRDGPPPGLPVIPPAGPVRRP